MLFSTLSCLCFTIKNIEKYCANNVNERKLKNKDYCSHKWPDKLCLYFVLMYTCSCLYLAILLNIKIPQKLFSLIKQTTFRLINLQFFSLDLRIMRFVLNFLAYLFFISTNVVTVGWKIVHFSLHFSNRTIFDENSWFNWKMIVL